MSLLLHLLDDPPSDLPAANLTSLRKEIERGAASVLSGEKEQSAFMLYLLGGTYSEVAEQTGWPLNTVNHAAVPCPPAVRRQDQPGRGVRLRGRRRRRGPQQVLLVELRLRDGRQRQPGVQALRLVLADPRRGVRRHGRGACPATPSRPTTAAWT